MNSYLLNGHEAQGKDYIGPLESLSDEEDLRIGVPGQAGLIVSACPEGFFVTEERADGSTFLATGLSKERVKHLLERFLSGAPDWRGEVHWELGALPKRLAGSRALFLILSGAVLLAIAWWLVGRFAE